MVPQDKLKQALTGKKKDSFKQCYEQSCQNRDRSGAGGGKALATQVMKVGTKCMVTCNLFDLKKATSGKAATARGRAARTASPASIDEVLQKLSVRPAPRALTPEPKAGVAPRAAPVATPVASAGEGGPPSQGWGAGGATTGFVGAAAALGLAVAAGVTTCPSSSDPGYVGGDCSIATSIGLGSAALVSMLVVGPIAAAGGASERRAGVRGIPGLRIAGWVGYSLTAVGGVVLVALSPDTTIPAATIATGVLGATSLVLLAAEALVSHSQAERLRAEPRSADSRRPRSRLVLAPFVTRARLPDGSGAGLFGVMGSF